MLSFILQNDTNNWKFFMYHEYKFLTNYCPCQKFYFLLHIYHTSSFIVVTQILQFIIILTGSDCSWKHVRSMFLLTNNLIRRCISKNGWHIARYDYLKSFEIIGAKENMAKCRSLFSTKHNKQTNRKQKKTLQNFRYIILLRTFTSLTMFYSNDSCLIYLHT